jgi:hypothetical protein
MEEKKNNHTVRDAFIIAGVVIGFFAICNTLSTDSSSQKSTPRSGAQTTTEPRNSPVVDQPYTPEKPPLEIADWNWTTDGDYVIYNVQVKNNSERYIEHCKVVFNSYDKAGKFITSDFTYVKGLAPGSTRSGKGYCTRYYTESKGKVYIE